LHADCDYYFPDKFEMQKNGEFLYFAGLNTENFTAEIVEVYGLEII